MPKGKIILSAIFQSIFTVVYVGVVSYIISNGEVLFGDIKGFLGVALFLLIFVISAAIMAAIVFGRAVVWYLDGKKKEAIRLVFYEIASLIVIALLVCFIFVQLSPVS